MFLLQRKMFYDAKFKFIPSWAYTRGYNNIQIKPQANTLPCLHQVRKYRSSFQEIIPHTEVEQRANHRCVVVGTAVRQLGSSYVLSVASCRVARSTSVEKFIALCVWLLLWQILFNNIFKNKIHWLTAQSQRQQHQHQHQQKQWDGQQRRQRQWHIGPGNLSQDKSS